MDRGNFYFITDDYYRKFHKEKLMINREVIDGQVHNRPCYYAFPDEEEQQIYWMVPVSSQTEKYEREYSKSMKKYRMCDTISFGYLKGERTAFLLQNMCPVTEKYILNQYFYADTGKPVTIPSDLRRELNAKVRKILRFAKRGKKLTFTEILKMKEELLNENQQEKEETKMNENRTKRNELLAKQVIKGLAQRNVEGYYAESGEAALKLALSMIPEGSSVGWGGSASVEEIGLKEAVCQGNYTVHNRDIAKTPEEKKQAEIACFDCDYFLASANALTMDGEMVNIDKFGNRIAAIAYGAKHVILIVGMNKIVRSLDEAVGRARNEAAPVNSVRLNTGAPCCNTGRCYDCKSEKTICCQFLVTRYSAVKGRVKVILVNEMIGF